MNVHHPKVGGISASAFERTPRSLASVLKRVVDVVVAGATLVLTLPMLLVAAAAIRLDSPGPVIVRHVRVGRDGVPFDLYRLRSTTCDTAEMTHVGRALRWSSVDELPHLWNVLRGDMSLIGPHPATPGQAAGGSFLGDSTRLRSVPGLTGTWIEAGDSRRSWGSETRTDLGTPPEGGGSDCRAG